MRSKLLLLSLAAICSFFAVGVNAQSYAITNARIVTVSGATIDKGTIVVRDGLIAAVGANVATPADAQVIDATGLTVYPGFIDALTTLGLAAPAAPAGGGARPGGGGFPAVGAPAALATTAAAPPASNSNYAVGLRPELMASEELKASEASFEAARNAGFTTVLTVGRTGIFNGQSAVIDLAGDSVSEMILKDSFAEHISYATTPGQFPGSLLGTFAQLRQMFLDAQRQHEIQKMYAANPRGIKRPEADKSLDALMLLLNRQIPVVFNANTEREIIRSIDLANEFHLKAIIAGGQESWKVADRLKAANIPVMLSLNMPRRTTAAAAEADPESLAVLRQRAEAPKCAAKLAAAGVKFVFQSGNTATIGDFFTNAGKAIEGGLSKDAAIRAMTLGSAELFGVSDRTGSIETGKIANLTVIKGDLFGRDKFAPYIIVDGKLFEQKEAPRGAPGAGRNGGGRPTGGGNPGGVGTSGGGGDAPGGGNSISGSYAITIDIPGSPLASTLNFNQQGSSFTGTMVSQAGTNQMNNGRLTGNGGFSFSSTVNYGGQTLDITVTGTVNGTQINGTVISAAGSIPFSGTKNP